MLDHETFVTEMHALADRFNRQVSDEMVRRYYEDLQHLDTDTFLTAARVVYRNDTFWPPPNRFLEAAGVDPASEAEREWERTLDLVRAGQGMRTSETHPALASALRAVGGTTTLGRTNEDRLPFVKREFVKAYKAQGERTPALEPVTLPGLGQ